MSRQRAIAVSGEIAHPAAPEVDVKLTLNLGTEQDDEGPPKEI